MRKLTGNIAQKDLKKRQCLKARRTHSPVTWAEATAIIRLASAVQAKNLAGKVANEKRL